MGFEWQLLLFCDRIGVARWTTTRSSRVGVIQRTGRKCLRSGIVQGFALFDSSSAKGDNCVAGDVAYRTRSNPHAFGVHGFFAAGAGCVYGPLYGVVADRDKHDQPGTAIESSGDGRAGCRTAGSICNGILGQTRTRILIQDRLRAGAASLKIGSLPVFFLPEIKFVILASAEKALLGLRSTLYVADYNGKGLAKINTTALSLPVVGPWDKLTGAAELTRTGITKVVEYRTSRQSL